MANDLDSITLLIFLLLPWMVLPFGLGIYAKIRNHRSTKLTSCRFLAWIAVCVLADAGILLALLPSPDRIFYHLPPSRLSVEHVTIPVKGLADHWHGLKVAHLSDLHFTPSMDRSTMAVYMQAITKVQSEQPDVVVISGDLVNREAASIASAIELLRLLHPPLGMYATLGNHDYLDSPHHHLLLHALEGSNITLLTNQSITLHPSFSASSSGRRPEDDLMILGVDFYTPSAYPPPPPSSLSVDPSTSSLSIDPDLGHSFLSPSGIDPAGGISFLSPSGIDPAASHSFLSPAVLNRSSATPHLIISHDPDWAEYLKQYRADVILSGHTHGGQICFPSPTPNRGAPVLPWLQKLQRLLPRLIAKHLPSEHMHFAFKHWEWAQGLHHLEQDSLSHPGHVYLYVSRGLKDVYRRLFCDPEVTIITLVQETEPS